MLKDLTEVKIFQKVLGGGGYFFLKHLVHIVTTDHSYELIVVAYQVNCAIADLIWSTFRSFQLFSSVNKCIAYCYGFWLTADDLTKCDTADDLEWPLKVISFRY